MVKLGYMRQMKINKYHGASFIEKLKSAVDLVHPGLHIFKAIAPGMTVRTVRKADPIIPYRHDKSIRAYLDIQFYAMGGTGMFNYISDRVRCGARDDSLLQIDQDQGGLRVEGG